MPRRTLFAILALIAGATTVVLRGSWARSLSADPAGGVPPRAEAWKDVDPKRVATELADSVRVRDADFLVMVSEALREASRLADAIEDSEWRMAIDGKPSIERLEMKKRETVLAVIDQQVVVDRLIAISNAPESIDVVRALANLVLHRQRRVADGAKRQAENFAKLREVVAERESLRRSFVNAMTDPGKRKDDGGTGMAATDPK